MGQEHVTDPISTALDTGRISHAYLFSGPRGCGKTSSARILARSLNCVEGPTSTPCGVCSSCVALGPGGPGNLDVIELDAASHGGVDDTRELRDRAFYAPAESRYRVFIVDEAHMVTTAGFNALLKIVEEPPAHLIFIFATTEPDKVLPTIRSRTHHYPFRLLPPATMRGLLGKICDQESVEVEEAVYPLVIRAGGGSPRDSLSVLDQLLAGAGPEGVTYNRAVSLLGVTDVALIDDAVEALAADDGAALFGTVDRVMEAGHDPRRFAVDLLERFRDLILMRAVPDAVERNLVTGPGDVLERMGDQAQRIGAATLARYAELLHEGLGEMRGATAPRLLLEIVCARMLLPSVSDAESATLQRLERLERGGVPTGATAPAAPNSAPGARPESAPARPAAADPGRRRGAEALAALRAKQEGPPPGDPTSSAEPSASQTSAPTQHAAGATQQASAPASSEPAPQVSAQLTQAQQVSAQPTQAPQAQQPSAPPSHAPAPVPQPHAQAPASSQAHGQTPHASGPASQAPASASQAQGQTAQTAGPAPQPPAPTSQAHGQPTQAQAPAPQASGRAPASQAAAPASGSAPQASVAADASAVSARAAETPVVAPPNSTDSAGGAVSNSVESAQDRPEGVDPRGPVADVPRPDSGYEPAAASAREAKRVAVASPSSTVESEAAQVNSVVQPQATGDSAAVREAAPESAPAPAASPAAAAVPGSDELLRSVEAAWADIRAKVREFGAAVQALLSGASVARIEGDVIVFAHQHAPLAKRLSEPRNIEAVRSAVRAVLGRDHDIRWEAGAAVARPQAAQVVAKAARAAAQPGQAARGAGTAGGAAAPPRFSRPSQAKNAQAGGPPGQRSGPEPKSFPGDDDIPPPDFPDLPDDPGPFDSPPAELGGESIQNAVPRDLTPEEEQELLAEAAKPVAPEDRRDPDEVALELLRSELGATRIDG